MKSLDSLLVELFLVLGFAHVEQLVSVNSPDESIIIALELACSHVVHVNLKQRSLLRLFVSLFLVEVDIDFEGLSCGEEGVSEHDDC